MKKKNIVGMILLCFIGLLVWSMVSIRSKGKYSDLGFTAYKKGDYRGAIENYTKVIELKPDDAFLYNNRGLAYFELGKYDKAISDYTKAMELKADYEVAYYNRGLAYFKKGSWRNNEPFKSAIADFSKAIELDPDYADAYYNRGLAYNKFVHYYNKPFSDDDKDKYNKAIADFDKTFELDSSYMLTLAGKANAIYRHGDWKEAEKLYNEVLKHKKKIIDKVGFKGLADVYYSRGRNYLNFIDIEKALSDFKKQLNLDPKHDAANSYLIMINMELEQYEEALKVCNEFIEKKKEGSSEEDAEFASYPYTKRGEIYYHLKKYDKAIDNLKKALKMPSGYGGGMESIRRWLAKSYKEKGETQKVKEELQQAISSLNKKIIRMKKQGHRFYMERGLCYLELEQYDKAISDFKKIINAKAKTDRRVYFWNSYLDANKNIGVVHSKMGNREKAKEHFQATIKLAEERGNNRVMAKTQKLLAEL